ncbi:glycosyltransferase family 4 protein [Halpernia frigidisoli]|uniref:Glycosyltransferase involved in cell wall bisynthesis n=1 Tax=Halpernia frigidisoli TaxID=1125876 RepID=A0A1I3FDZ7_9FLAO|nr:glycosyltransferase family 4 protein [Halpernia frigidisoli]SFI09438.1 Glycosyltransferase involved in cell wall bisynthesis [Halpernia frigidisoli]
MKKLFRISTVPMSLNILLKGQLRFLDQFYEVTAISGAGKYLEEVENREGVKTHVLEMQRQISPLKDLVSLYRLYIYFKKEKPDIIHSITPKAGLLSMIAGKLANVPVRMHTFTGLIFPSKKGFLKLILINMDRLLTSCGTDIFPEGEGVKSDLLKYNITRKPLKIIGNGNINGIDLQYFKKEIISDEVKTKITFELKISPQDFVFIFVGRLVGDKGINELTKAFKEVNKNFPDSKLLLVGPFEHDTDPLESKTISEIGNNKSILHLGYQDDVRPYFAVSDVLVFPSYREGFPNVVLQALAMEIPALVSDINGCREIITSEENGWFVPSENVKILKMKMSEILHSPDSVQAMKSNCRESILKYDQKVLWDKLLRTYQLSR